MELKSSLIDRILKSFGFSLFLFLVWGTITVRKAIPLLERFTWFECLWLFYNASISILFLIRSRPSVVSRNPWHWLVALMTSFSGLFFIKYDLEILPLWLKASDGLIFVGLFVGGVSAVTLGRSYDFLPALRGVQTQWLYEIIRHPMYLSSILIRLGYLVKNFSSYNMALFAVMVWLYDKRAKYEEGIMQNSPRYQAYMKKVRFRFLPKVY
jgi:protein-S-isoprenylcysteine O-methyltransferase Ste14